MQEPGQSFASRIENTFHGRVSVKDANVISGNFITNSQIYQNTSSQGPPRFPPYNGPGLHAFVARPSISEQIDHHFNAGSSSDKAKIVLLHGLPGSGKSLLARHIAENAVATKQNVYWLDSSTLDTMTLSWIKFARRGRLLDDLDLKNSNFEDIQRNIWSFLRPLESDFLLIFDNFDSDGSGTYFSLDSHIPHNNHGRILITSRNAHVASQHDCLKVPVRSLTIDESLRLFRQQVDIPSEGQTEQETTLSRYIVEDLAHCLPLAVAQAAGCVRYTLPPGATLLSRLRDYVTSFEMEHGLALAATNRSLEPQYAKSVLNAFTTSFVSLENRHRAAAQLLLLFSCLHFNNIQKVLMEQMCLSRYQVAEIGISFDDGELKWLFDMLTVNHDGQWHEAPLRNAVNTLEDFAFLQVHNAGQRNEYWNVHPLVHSWALQYQQSADMTLQFRSMLKVALGTLAASYSLKDMPGQVSSSVDIDIALSLNVHIGSWIVAANYAKILQRSESPLLFPAPLCRISKILDSTFVQSHHRTIRTGTQLIALAVCNGLRLNDLKDNHTQEAIRMLLIDLTLHFDLQIEALSECLDALECLLDLSDLGSIQLSTHMELMLSYARLLTYKHRKFRLGHYIQTISTILDERRQHLTPSFLLESKLNLLGLLVEESADRDSFAHYRDEFFLLAETFDNAWSDPVLVRRLQRILLEASIMSNLHWGEHLESDEVLPVTTNFIKQPFIPKDDDRFKASRGKDYDSLMENGMSEAFGCQLQQSLQLSLAGGGPFDARTLELEQLLLQNRAALLCRPDIAPEEARYLLLPFQKDCMDQMGSHMLTALIQIALMRKALEHDNSALSLWHSSQEQAALIDAADASFYSALQAAYDTSKAADVIAQSSETKGLANVAAKFNNVYQMISKSAQKRKERDSCSHRVRQVAETWRLLEELECKDESSGDYLSNPLAEAKILVILDNSNPESLPHLLYTVIGHIVLLLLYDYSASSRPPVSLSMLKRLRQLVSALSSSYSCLVDNWKVLEVLAMHMHSQDTEASAALTHIVFGTLHGLRRACKSEKSQENGEDSSTCSTVLPFLKIQLMKRQWYKLYGKACHIQWTLQSSILGASDTSMIVNMRDACESYDRAQAWESLWSLLNVFERSMKMNATTLIHTLDGFLAGHLGYLISKGMNRAASALLFTFEQAMLKHSSENLPELQAFDEQDVKQYHLILKVFRQYCYGQLGYVIVANDEIQSQQNLEHSIRKLIPADNQEANVAINGLLETLDELRGPPEDARKVFLEKFC